MCRNPAKLKAVREDARGKRVNRLTWSELGVKWRILLEPLFMYFRCSTSIMSSEFSNFQWNLLQQRVGEGEIVLASHIRFYDMKNENFNWYAHLATGCVTISQITSKLSPFVAPITFILSDLQNGTTENRNIFINHSGYIYSRRFFIQRITFDQQNYFIANRFAFGIQCATLKFASGKTCHLLQY